MFGFETTQLLFISAVSLFTMVATVCDLRSRKVPNWLTVTGLVTGLAYQTIAGEGFLFSLAGFGTGFGILLVLWLIGGGGGGDVKLMGALGAWLGAESTLYVFFLSTIFAIVATMAVMTFGMLQHGYSYVCRRYSKNRPMSKGRGSSVETPEAYAARRVKRRVLPYALPVMLGTWVLLAWQALADKC